MKRHLSTLTTIATLGLLLVIAAPAVGQSLAELGATTSIHGTLAGNSAGGVAETLGSVRRSIAASEGRANAAWRAAGDANAATTGPAAKGWVTGASAGKDATVTAHGWVRGGDDTRQAALRR